MQRDRTQNQWSIQKWVSNTNKKPRTYENIKGDKTKNIKFKIQKKNIKTNLKVKEFEDLQ